VLQFQAILDASNGCILLLPDLNLPLQVLFFIFGALLLVVGILGGGVEVKNLITIPQVPWQLRTVAAITGVLSIYVAIWQPWPGGRSSTNMSEMDVDTDRYGSDFSSFTIGGPKACEDKCMSEPKCKAWTFEKRDTNHGPLPWCYLNAELAPSRPNPCCITGFKMK
jgi:hypothetical protein